MENFEYIAKRTDELSAEEKSQVVDLFNRVFNRSESEENLINKYSPPGFMTSFHGVLYCDHRIVGITTIIPFKYEFFGEVVTFGLVCDTMIDPDYRKNFFALKLMFEPAETLLKENGIVFVYAIPNDQSLGYFMKIVKWEAVGVLNYYAFPLSLRVVSPKLVVLDRLYKWCAKGINLLLFWLTSYLSTREPDKDIRKVCDAEYEKYRFSSYDEINNADNTCYYTESLESGLNAIFIIDSRGQEVKGFSKNILKIASQHSTSDLIIFISHRKRLPLNLIKIPEAYQPRKVSFVGKCIDKDFSRKVFDIDNWEVSLANFDVR